MAYIDTKHLFKCETCRHCIGDIKCDTFCDVGEQYVPDMTKIPTSDVVEVSAENGCLTLHAQEKTAIHTIIAVLFAEEKRTKANIVTTMCLQIFVTIAVQICGHQKRSKKKPKQVKRV